MIKQLWERYILWRLTPAEQLIYRALKVPGEWRREGDAIIHKRTGVALMNVERTDRIQAFYVSWPIGNYNAHRVAPGRVARRRFYRMAHRIYNPPPPSWKQLQAQLFEHLMKAELGEKP